MKIKINNEIHELAAGTTVGAIACVNSLPDKGVAVAVNNEMVPREEWGGRALKDGDEIVILKAFCGG